MPRALPSKSKSPKTPSADRPTAAPRKRPAGRPFAKGHDPRRGVGKAGRSGRPADELRARLTGSIGDRVAVLEEFADGLAVVKTKIELQRVFHQIVDLLEVKDGKIVPKDADLLKHVEIEALVSPSPKDRIHAIDTMFKYGPGTPPQEIKGKFTGKATVNVVIKREGRRVTAS